VAPEGSNQCTDCPDDQVPSSDKSECVSCPEGETATSGLCVKDSKDGVDASNSEDKLEGVLANNGTPFYIMAILVVMLGGLGFAVHGSKKMVPDVLILSEAAHLLPFMLNSAGMMSEMVLATAVVSSGDQSLLPFGIMLVASRVIVGATPGVMVFSSIFSGKDVPLVDETTGKKALKYFINGDVIVANSKLYVFMLALSVLEPTLLAFLPWYETEISSITRFPTLQFMKRVYFFETLQLMVTLAAQLGIIFQTQVKEGGTFGIIVIMNVAFSGFMLLVKGSDMALKWLVLRGAGKDEDCEAAKNAWKKVEKERSGEGIELGNVYDRAEDAAGTPRRDTFTQNPMLLENAISTARAREEEEQEESLLSRFRTEWETRMQAVEDRQSHIETRQDLFERGE